jgi:hypothetical protein
MKSAGLAVLLAAVAQPASGPPAAAPAQPKWVVDWGDQRCALIRVGHPVGISLRVIPGTNEVELLVFNDSWPARLVEDVAAPVSVSLGAGQAPADHQAYLARLGNRQVIVLDSLERAFIDKFAAGDMLSIAGNARPLASLPLPAARQAVAALAQCEDDLLKTWGFDPRVIATLRSRAEAKGGAAAWLSNDDYPDDAIRREASGASLARLTVGIDGLASGCTIVDSSGSKTLDEKTCSIYTNRVRYTPAIDASGKPVPAPYSVRIRWLIPHVS